MDHTVQAATRIPGSSHLSRYLPETGDTLARGDLWWRRRAMTLHDAHVSHNTTFVLFVYSDQTRELKLMAARDKLDALK